MERLLLSITESISDVIIDFRFFGFRQMLVKMLKSGGWIIVVILVLLCGLFAFRNKGRKKIRSVVE